MVFHYIQIRNLDGKAEKYLIKFQSGSKWLKMGPYSFFVPPVKFCILRVLSILELLLNHLFTTRDLPGGALVLLS